MSDHRAHRLLLFTYLVNATLVLCHEVDAAYWHEWELFHLPGGAAGFVAMHLLLVPLILAGLVVVARDNPAARWWSFAIGIAGCAGCAVHLAFLADGNERFSTPFSIALVVAFGLSSGALAVVAATARRTGKHRGTTLAVQSLIVLALVLSAGLSAVIANRTYGFGPRDLQACGKVETMLLNKRMMNESCCAGDENRLRRTASGNRKGERPMVRPIPDGTRTCPAFNDSKGRRRT